MDCKMTRLDCDSVLILTKDGCKVTIHFRREDNPDIEDIVTDNLITSYERRIKKNVISGVKNG